jgi:hypothetical protein
MAISVDKVYKTVLSILNKESRGFLTPDEFNKIGEQVQLDILDQNFYEYNRAVIKHNAGRAVQDYGNIPEKIEQKLDPFFKTSNLALTASAITLPSDLYKTIAVTVKNRTVQLEKINKNKLSYLLSSPLTKPSNSFPVYYQTDTQIVAEPTLTGNLTLDYIKVPVGPTWAYETDANGALTFSENTGVSVTPTTGKVDFVLHESDRVSLIIGILKYAGLVIADPGVIQAATAEENKTIQLENS